MSSVENTPEKSVIERFLNLAVSSVHHRLAPDSHTTLALSLHHPHASVRLRAVTYLLDTVDSVSEAMLEWLCFFVSLVVTTKHHASWKQIFWDSFACCQAEQLQIKLISLSHNILMQQCGFSPPLSLQLRGFFSFELAWVLTPFLKRLFLMRV